MDCGKSVNQPRFPYHPKQKLQQGASRIFQQPIPLPRTLKNRIPQQLNLY
jgi:hypothetical protein